MVIAIFMPVSSAEFHLGQAAVWPLLRKPVPSIPKG
jgi:hypothetical protein